MLEKNRPQIIVAIISIIIISIVFYGIAIEPKYFSVQSMPIYDNELPNSWNNTKIVVFSDCLVKDSHSSEFIQKITRKINEQNPDIIIYGGDLLNKNNVAETFDQNLIEYLSMLRAPLGKFTIIGDNDIDEKLYPRIERIYQAAGFQIINDTNRHIYNNSLEAINIIPLNNSTTVEKKNELLATSNDVYSLLLTTSTNDFANITAYPNIRISFGFSTLGGNIGIPGIRNIFVDDNSNNYIHGTHKKGNQQLFVSSGLGINDNFPFRVLNSPKIYSYTLIKN